MENNVLNYIAEMAQTYPQLGHAKNLLGKYKGKLTNVQKDALDDSPDE